MWFRLGWALVEECGLWVCGFVDMQVDKFFQKLTAIKIALGSEFDGVKRSWLNLNDAEGYIEGYACLWVAPLAKAIAIQYIANDFVLIDAIAPDELKIVFECVNDFVAICTFRE